MRGGSRGFRRLPGGGGDRIRRRLGIGGALFIGLSRLVGGLRRRFGARRQILDPGFRLAPRRLSLVGGIVEFRNLRGNRGEPGLRGLAQVVGVFGHLVLLGLAGRQEALLRLLGRRGVGGGLFAGRLCGLRGLAGVVRRLVGFRDAIGDLRQRGVARVLDGLGRRCGLLRRVGLLRLRRLARRLERAGDVGGGLRRGGGGTLRLRREVGDARLNGVEALYGVGHRLLRRRERRARRDERLGLLGGMRRLGLARGLRFGHGFRLGVLIGFALRLRLGVRVGFGGRFRLARVSALASASALAAASALRCSSS